MKDRIRVLNRLANIGTVPNEGLTGCTSLSKAKVGPSDNRRRRGS